MSAHDGHDHENTKAARAKCRRGKGANALPPMDDEAKARIKAGGPIRKPKSQRAAQPDPALPHEFDPVIGAPGKCYVCGRRRSADVHDHAAEGGPGRFVFDKNGKLTGLRLW